MLKLNGHSLLLGGFHDHWSRWDKQNPALLLAALNYYHYDFVTLMCGPDTDAAHRAAARQITDRIKIYPGREEFFGWGHVLTINPIAPRLEGDDPDYRNTLRRLQATSDLVILAHPNYPGTWETIFQTGEMDRLLDEGIIDGVNLINTNGFEVPSHRELIQWFNQRDAAGLKTPIVGGWDAHLVLPQKSLPPVLYTRERPPRGHIDTCGANRTILFCEENSLEAIIETVRAGRTVIEDLATGGLVGPAPLVEFLKVHDYAGAIAELDAWRDAQTLTVPVSWISGKQAVLESPAGVVKVAVPTVEGVRIALTLPRQGQIEVTWPASPGGRDKDYATIAVRNEGGERIWAVETQHPVQLEVLPHFEGGEPGLELVPQIPFDGTASVQIPELLEWTGQIAGRKRLELPESATNRVYSAEWRATDTEGIGRAENIDLTLLTAPQFRGDWDAISMFAVDDARFIPGYTYGAKRPYPGADVFAVYYQFAWDEMAFYCRARVRDGRHFQPATEGHYLYNADCLQLAIDPLLRRHDSVGHVYSFNLALTPNGPLAHRWLAPDSEDAPGFAAPTPDTPLGRDCLEITPWEGGLIYDLRLPWCELAPARPEPGVRLGIYTIAFNNDGDGLLDTLHWPVPIDGMWQMPRRWGVISLV